jgi:DNA-binding protein Fis
MTTVAIRKKLTDYLKVADDKKIKAIYALVEDDIEQPALEYSEELKAELDKRYAAYKKGGKMISGSEAQKQISKILAS